MINLPKLLNDSGAEIRRLHPVSLSITEQAVPLSTASLTLLVSEMIPDRSYVELFVPGRSVGIFRTRTPTSGYGGISNTYQLEHAICEVGDYLVRADIDQTEKTLSSALTQVFSYYSGNRWQLGSVCAGNVVLNARWNNVLQTMNSLIAQVSGALMTFDFSTTPWTINVVKHDSVVSAEGRLRRNIQRVQIQKDDKNLCTRVWLNGLSGGHMDANTISTYGVIEKQLPDRQYTRAQAETVAASYLEKYKYPAYRITINGNDFSQMTGEDLDQVRIGKLYRLAIPKDNIVLSENVVTLSWSNLCNDETAVTITLSEPEKTIVDFVQKQTSDYYGAGGEYVNQQHKYKEYETRFVVNERAIEAEATRAQTAERNLIAKDEDFQTVAQIVADAHAAASAAATTAMNASIARTNVYQTAEAIVTSAVALAKTAGDETYIAQTASFQTADAIKNEAVRVAGNNAAAAYLAKTNDYATVDAIIQEAETLASNAATTAQNASIAKTSTLQTAEAIVNTAVAQAATAAGSTYIAKTSTYQTADAIVSTAERYTDGEISGVSSQISQQADKIAMVVGTYPPGSSSQYFIKAAQIVAEINEEGSSVKIDADHVDIAGSQFVQDISDELDGLMTGIVQATNIHTLGLTIYDSLILTRGLSSGRGWNFGVSDIVAGTSPEGRTQYYVVAEEISI